MAPLSTSTLLVGSIGLTNLSSSRHRPASLAGRREEGWTESWGGKDRNNGNGNDEGGDAAGRAAAETPHLPPRYVAVTRDGSDYVGGGDGGASRRDPPKLTQYRVAWLEQIVLRMNYLPHAVENSGYAAAESTGGLPFLLDSSCREVPHRVEGGDAGDDGGDDAKRDDVAEWGRAWKTSLTRLDKPVLIGRNQPGGLGSNFFRRPLERDGENPSSPNLNPSWFLPSGSHIVDYLRLKHSHRTKGNLLFQEHLRGSPSFGDAVAYESLIRDKLDYVLLALRYGDDPAWEGVHRPRCLRAAADPRGTAAASDAGRRRTSFFPLWAWYQTYSERALALHNLLPSKHAASPSAHGGLALELFRYNDYRHSGAGAGPESDRGDDDDDSAEEEEDDVHQHHPASSLFPSYAGVGGGDSGRVNARRAAEFADAFYASLEAKLASHGGPAGDGAATHLLGTEKPTYVDALLFAHLAEALRDAHLVPVLAGRPLLLEYFRRTYDRYFGEGYADEWESRRAGRGAGDARWIRENDLVNARNAFNRIPEVAPSEPGSASVDAEGHDAIRAIRLMQQMAARSGDMDEAVPDAVALRTSAGEGEDVLLESYHRPTGSRLYRWIMGGEVTFWGYKSSHANGGDDHDHDDGSRSSSDGEDGEKPVSDEEEKKQRLFRERLKHAKRDRRQHDEIWLSGVVVTVVAALVLSASSGKRKQ